MPLKKIEKPSTPDCDSPKNLTGVHMPEQCSSTLKLAMDHSTIGMAVIGIDGQWEDFNQSICHMLGYSRDELQQLTFQDITHPGDLEMDLRYLGELLADKRTSYQIEKRYIHKNGSIVCACLLASLVKHGNGKLLHVISLIEDISEKKKKALALQEREQQYKSLFEQNHAAVFSVDLDGYITTANSVMAVKAETTVEQLIGRHYSEFVNPVDLHLADEALDAVKSGEARETKLRVYTLNGNELHINLVLLPVIVHKRITGAYAVAHDITVDQHAREQLEKAIRDLNKIMEASLDIICTIDRSGKFVQVSAAVERVLGYKPAELLGKAFIELVYPDDLPATHQVVKELLSGLVKTNFENRYIKKNGNVVPIIWSGRYDERDQLIYCIARDASESKIAASENLRLSHVLQKSLNEIYIFDAQSFVVAYANEGALQNTGYTLAEIKTKTFLHIQGINNRKALQSLVKPLLNNKKEKVTFEGIHHRADGSHYHVEVHLQITQYNDQPVLLAFVQDISERVQAEQEKEFERRNKEALINSTKDLVWSIDRDMQLITANDAFLQLVAVFSGRHLKAGDSVFVEGSLTPAQKSQWEHLYRRALSGEVFCTEIYTPATATTKESWREVNFNTILDGTAIIGAAIYSCDVTQEKRMLQQLQESEQRFRSLIENSADMLTLINPAGAIAYISPAVERTYGFSIKKITADGCDGIGAPCGPGHCTKRLAAKFSKPGYAGSDSF